MKRIFSAHNDEDEGLDGLELYKAIKHAKSHETTENGDDQTDEEKIQSKVKFLIHFLFINSAYLFENEFICLIHCIPQIFPDLVDYLLDTYDSDFNGILDFPEFMKAFEETRAQLGVS